MLAIYELYVYGFQFLLVIDLAVKHRLFVSITLFGWLIYRLAVTLNSR